MRKLCRGLFFFRLVGLRRDGPARPSSGTVEIVDHPDLHAVPVHDDIDRADMLIGMGFDELIDIQLNDVIGYVFSFDADFHTIISFKYSNSCFISYGYIVAEKLTDYQLQVHHFLPRYRHLHELQGAQIYSCILTFQFPQKIHYAEDL